MASRPRDNTVFGARKLTCVRGERVLFENLSFSLKPGEVLVVRGPNGSGKTSLLRLLAGFLGPEAGAFQWQGETARHARKLLQGSLHYLGHAQALKSHLTVLENLVLWARLYGARSDFAQACGEVGLAGFEDFPVRFLSEGQRKRVNLARLIAVALPLWLLDEPVAGLDKGGQALLADLVKRHTAGGGMVVVATHQELDVTPARTLTLGRAK